MIRDMCTYVAVLFSLFLCILARIPTEIAIIIAVTVLYVLSKYNFLEKIFEKILTLRKSHSYDKVGYFRDGLAPALVNNKYGYVNKNWKMIIPPQFDEAYEFNNGAAKVFDKAKGKYGLIDVSGRWIVEPQFDDIGDFREGLAPVGVKTGETFYACLYYSLYGGCF